jgi:hypothetical protein
MIDITQENKEKLEPKFKNDTITLNKYQFILQKLNPLDEYEFKYDDLYIVDLNEEITYKNVIILGQNLEELHIDILYEEYLRIQRKKKWVNGYTGIIEVKRFPNNPVSYKDFFNYRNYFEWHVIDRTNGIWYGVGLENKPDNEDIEWGVVNIESATENDKNIIYTTYLKLFCNTKGNFIILEEWVKNNPIILNKTNNLTMD